MHKYRLLGKKGEGTFSEVLEAQSIATGRYLAIKCMKTPFKNMEQVNQLKEIQALRKLSPHPHIIQLHEVLYEQPTGRLALVLELMDMNMYESIKSCQRYMQETRVRWYMWQLIKAMDHMHRNGIFHRDIKPENILLLKDELKLADLGSCRGMNSRPPFTEYVSTRWYRAPECLMTDGYYNYKMDMWGVGCVFFEVLSLFPLFPGTNEIDQIQQIFNILGTPTGSILPMFKSNSSHMHLNFHPQSGTGIAHLVPHATPECLELLDRLLVYNPDERFSARQALKHPYFKELRSAEKAALKHMDPPCLYIRYTKPSLSSSSTSSSSRSLSCVFNEASKFSMCANTKDVEVYPLGPLKQDSFIEERSSRDLSASAVVKDSDSCLFPETVAKGNLQLSAPPTYPELKGNISPVPKKHFAFSNSRNGGKQEVLPRVGTKKAKEVVRKRREKEDLPLHPHVKRAPPTELQQKKYPPQPDPARYHLQQYHHKEQTPERGIEPERRSTFAEERKESLQRQQYHHILNHHHNPHHQQRPPPEYSDDMPENHGKHSISTFPIATSTTTLGVSPMVGSNAGQSRKGDGGNHISNSKQKHFHHCNPHNPYPPQPLPPSYFECVTSRAGVKGGKAAEAISSSQVRYPHPLPPEEERGTTLATRTHASSNSSSSTTTLPPIRGPKGLCGPSPLHHPPHPYEQSLTTLFHDPMSLTGAVSTGNRRMEGRNHKGGKISGCPARRGSSTVLRSTLEAQAKKSHINSSATNSINYTNNNSSSRIATNNINGSSNSSFNIKIPTTILRKKFVSPYAQMGIRSRSKNDQ